MPLALGPWALRYLDGTVVVVVEWEPDDAAAGLSVGRRGGRGQRSTGADTTVAYMDILMDPCSLDILVERVQFVASNSSPRREVPCSSAGELGMYRVDGKVLSKGLRPVRMADDRC